MTKILIHVITITILLLNTAASLAVIPGEEGGGCTNFFTCIGNIPDPTSGTFGGEQGLPAKVINVFLPIVIGLAGMIAVIIIIISGIQFITSSGNPEAANAARGRLIYAIIGFAIVVLAFAALQIIDNIFLGNSGIV